MTGEARGLAELLDALGISSVESLEETIVERVEFDVDSAWCSVGAGFDDDPLSVELGSHLMTTSVLAEVSFPITVSEFWSQIDDLDVRASREADYLRLPTVTGDDAPNRLVEVLAHQFGWVEDELFDILGGGWRSCDGEASRGLEVTPLSAEPAVTPQIGPADYRSWYCTGSPPLLVLGIGRTSSIVARPVVVPDSFAGPGCLELHDIKHVATTDFGDSSSDAEALLSSTLERARALLPLCHGCRRTEPPVTETEYSSPLCRACAYSFLGLIVD